MAHFPADALGPVSEPRGATRVAARLGLVAAAHDAFELGALPDERRFAPGRIVVAAVVLPAGAAGSRRVRPSERRLFILAR
jgi:hypothetical protein